MTLNSKISVIVICVHAKMDRFKSLNFDFGVFNFNTMKLISFAKMPKNLALSGF